MKIDWKKKLSSRKFWAAIIGFVSPLLLAFGLGEGTVTEITGIIMSAGTLIAYIISEGFVDASQKNLTEVELEEIPEYADYEDAVNATEIDYVNPLDVKNKEE